MAQLQLGHSSVTTTLRDYTDRGVQGQAAAAEALQAALANAVDKPVDNPPADPAAEESLDKVGKTADSVSAKRPMLTLTTPRSPARAIESRRTTPRDVSQQPGARRDSAAQEGCTPSTSPAAAIARTVLEWAILDSTQYPPQPRAGESHQTHDLPPRAAAIVHHALRVMELEIRTRRAQGAPDDVAPSAPAPSGRPD